MISKSGTGQFLSENSVVQRTQDEFEHRVFTMTLDDTEIAHVELVLFRSKYSRDPVGYVHDVWTKEANRNRGLATQLLNKAVDCAKEKGCYKVFLVCQSGVEGFYEKRGMPKSGSYMKMMLK
jgi:GNAT superfamily N-acetyltransferase